MKSASITLTVFFEAPFWVGVFERIENEALSVSKITFGAEPKSSEILQMVDELFFQLKFSNPAAMEIRQTADGPKRRLRNAKKQVREAGIGTKSQQALQAQREAMVAEQKCKSRLLDEEEKRRRFQLKQEKRREKHLGH